MLNTNRQLRYVYSETESPVRCETFIQPRTLESWQPMYKESSENELGISIQILAGAHIRTQSQSRALSQLGKYQHISRLGFCYAGV